MQMTKAVGSKFPSWGVWSLVTALKWGRVQHNDRGALEDTVIADGVILDNQIQLAHNVVLGEKHGNCGMYRDCWQHHDW